ncbi:MAG: CocE/NonD family hydrolase [Actinobacteria bacterium]|nr:MAG: CocE/NonD family hydrolase [Actinomycetota bacterium]
MLTCALAAGGVIAAAPAPARAWSPEPPRYGVAKQTGVPVAMADGTVLRADVYSPTDPATGQPASGPFPVIMVQTPYGKDTVGAPSGGEGGAEAATQAGAIPYMIQRGYIDVVAEVRGTGDSHGSFNLLDPIQAQDGAALVRWAAALPHSNGRVGLYGPSYMGLDEFMTANALGRDSPLKALFPIVAGNDPYRDVAFDGGLADGEFDLFAVSTIFGPLELVNPAAENPTDVADLLNVELEHVPALASYNLAQTANIASGGDEAYDEDYWQARAPRNMLGRVVANGIAAFMVGGWFDLFQRGEPLDYSGLQNAYRGRSVSAPMTPDEKATGRYQLLQGPWYHLTAGAGLDVYRIELAWFDRWLKDESTGIDETDTPLHLYDIGSNRWVDVSRYPLSEATPRTFFLAGGPSASGAPSDNDGRLASGPPSDPSAADTVAFTGATSPCDRQTEQWSAGASALISVYGQLPPNPCTADDRTLQSGPGALTYTTDPMSRDTVLAGPVDATIYASSTRPDVELVATLEDVSPDGTSFPLTSGALLGSFRALDQGLSWFAADGRPLIPYHPYTRASVAAVPSGQVTRFDVEVPPTLADIAAGHRLRLTLTTSDSPHLLATPSQAQDLTAGVYQVQRNAGAASYLEVPMAPPGAFSSSRLLAGARPVAARRPPRRCPSRRRLRIHIRAPRGVRYARVTIYVGPRRVRVLRRPRRGAVVDLHQLPSGPYTVRIVARTRSGKRIVHTRRYRACTPSPRARPRRHPAPHRRHRSGRRHRR